MNVWNWNVSIPKALHHLFTHQYGWCICITGHIIPSKNSHVKLGNSMKPTIRCSNWKNIMIDYFNGIILSAVNTLFQIDWKGFVTWCKFWNISLFQSGVICCSACSPRHFHYDVTYLIHHIEMRNRYYHMCWGLQRVLSCTCILYLLWHQFRAWSPRP